MTEPVIVALLSTIGLVFGGVLVELIRTRRSAARTEAAVSTPGDSQLGGLVTETRELVGKQGTRLAVIERLVEDHLKQPHTVLNGRRY